MPTPNVPTPGPCSDWIDGADVAERCTLLESYGSDPTVYDHVAHEASQILWALSGRQFSGVCQTTVRPCAPTCSCWPVLPAVSPGVLGTLAWDFGMGLWRGWYGGGGTNGCCGCLSRVKLAGYPVVQIDEVTIDGTVISADNYRLDGWRFLTYMDDAEGNPQRWPACQNLAAEDGQPGTFSVTYTFGVEPPTLGQDAAAELACMLATAIGGGDCGLPPGTTRITRQGVVIDLDTLAQALRLGVTGLPLTDLFLATFNPSGLSRRPTAWSPDAVPYAQKYG